MAYSLSNKYAKNLCKRTVLVQVIIKNVVTCFFGTQRLQRQVSTTDIYIYIYTTLFTFRQN